MSDPASNVELVRQLLSGPPPDAAGLPAFAEKWLDASITLTYPGASPIAFAGEWKGRQGVVDFMSTFHQHVEVERMDVGSFDGAADDVFVRGVTRGRVRRTGKTYTSNWLLVWTVKGGKISRMLEYHDTQAIASAFA